MHISHDQILFEPVTHCSARSVGISQFNISYRLRATSHVPKFVLLSISFLPTEAAIRSPDGEVAYWQRGLAEEWRDALARLLL